jgi:hypothetical protein
VETKTGVSAQLDILALEPFYGGVRRAMLEAIIRGSRHRWTLLKLPPRRIERRLAAASHWFAEQLSRHWVGNLDLLFTSEALNLSDLYRLMPALLKKPSVVYFHSDQLPDPAAVAQTPLDLVNLNTAAAASEIWFNSMFHLRSFLARAGALVKKHPELSSHSPMGELTTKAQIFQPPIDLSALHALAPSMKGQRSRRSIFVETRDSDISLLNAVVATLERRGEEFKLYTVGNLDGLTPDLPRIALPEADDHAQAKAMMECGIFLSVKHDAPVDHYAVRALAAGCWPLMPNSGVYRELIPEGLHSSCLYDGRTDQLTGRIQDVFHLEQAGGYEAQQLLILRRFDPVIACRAMDERLSDLTSTSSR